MTGAGVVFLVTTRDSLPQTPSQLYRPAVDGGAGQRVSEVENYSGHRCANQAANFCAVGSRSAGGKQMLIESFDVVTGQRKELSRIPVDAGADYQWALAPDGSQIPLAKDDVDAVQIRFVSLGNG
jgi:hypothetical protein